LHGAPLVPLIFDRYYIEAETVVEYAPARLKRNPGSSLWAVGLAAPGDTLAPKLDVELFTIVSDANVLALKLGRQPPLA